MDIGYWTLGGILVKAREVAEQTNDQHGPRRPKACVSRRDLRPPGKERAPKENNSLADLVICFEQYVLDYLCDG